MQQENSIVLAGRLFDLPSFSHVSNERRFFRFALAVQRMSGVEDILPVICEERLLPPVAAPGDPLSVRGQIRAYSRCDGGARLLIAAFCTSLSMGMQEPENRVYLCGRLTRPPVFRGTPLGREIADVFLAVSRGFGKSDYLPVIAWGRNARIVSGWQAGDRVEATGRLQSRVYQKTLPDGTVTERTAYEVSATSIKRV